MDELQPNKDIPHFSSLTEIMDRFQTVPYKQFQQELQHWFEHSLAKKNLKGTSKDKQVSPDLAKLSELVSAIYHQAEISHLLTDAKIPGRDESK